MKSEVYKGVAVLRNPEYVAKDHGGNLTAEGQDAIMRVMDAIGIIQEVEQGKVIGATDAMTSALDKALVEYQDLLNKVREREERTTWAQKHAQLELIGGAA